MGVHFVRNAGRRYRRSRRLRGSKRGVVSVVGTLLSLLVFFSLFGIFLTQFVPLWMVDNESQFTAQTQASMANLKANMDAQAAFNGPGIYATPFTMSSQGVPLIAQPTAGIMNFNSVQPGVYVNISMAVGPGGGKPFWQNFSIGTLTMTLPNRYYSSQIFSLENDAVIQSQADTQQIVAFPPAISITSQGASWSVTMMLAQMYGNATQSISSGTQEVYSHWISIQSFTSTGAGGAPFNAGFRLGTHFPCAWATYLNNTVVRAGLPAAHFTLTPSTCLASNGKAKMVNLSFLNISSFTLLLAQYSIVVGVGLG